MKRKIALFLLMAFFALSILQAQTEKGRFIVGAASSAEVSNTKGGLSTSSSSSFTTISIKPEVGYFIMDDLSVGISVSVSGNSSGTGNAYADVLSEFRYFFKGTNFRPFVKANAGYKYQDFWGLFGQNAPVADVHGFAFGGGVGGAFFVRNNVSIDLGLHYLYSNLKRVSAIYTASGPQKEDNPLKAKMNEVKVFIGFSVYL